MTKEVHPGILPVMSYKYDMRRAGYTEAERGPITRPDGWIWQETAHLLSANVLYGLAQYKGANGEDFTVDGGVLWFGIHNFCGGMQVASAFTEVYCPMGSSNSFNDGEYRTTREGRAERGRKSWAAGAAEHFERDRAFIPCADVYTGKATMTTAEARILMRRSLLAGILSAACGSGKLGIFAADVVAKGEAHTRPLLLLAPTVKRYFVYTPGVAAWPGQDEWRSNKKTCDLRIVHEEFRKVSAKYDAGVAYTNPNSGRRVSMASVVVTDYGAPDHEFYEWRIPKEEKDKLSSHELAMMCPQGLLFN